MPKRKHHYVPQFYLRNFQSQSKQINIFNISRSIAISNASLRNQCHKHRLYGPDSEVEDSLAALESAIAPVLAAMIRARAVPHLRSEDHYTILAFLSLQLLRTVAAVSSVTQIDDKVSSVVFNGDPPPEFELSDLQAMALSLGNLEEMSEMLSDLKIHLICAPPGECFITSDNPAYRYNQYCEGISHRGVCGGISSGLQVFMPLDPSTLVLLYDGSVYKVGHKQGPDVSTAERVDVHWLNRLQFIAAHNNVYFSDWSNRHCVKELAQRSRKLRKEGGPRVVEAVDIENENSSIIHTYHRMPNFKATLSFIRLRRKARITPLSDRVPMMRREFPDSLASDDLSRGRSKRVFQAKRRL